MPQLLTRSQGARPSACLRCGRKLTSLSSVARGYGRTCRSKIRHAQVADLNGYKPEQVAKAAELIEDAAILPLRGRRIFLTVSTDGSEVYRTAVTGQCTCPAGIKSRRCFHTAAARMVAAA